MFRTPGREVNQTLGEWLTPTPGQVARVSSWFIAHSVSLLERAASWWEEDEFVLIARPLFQPDGSVLVTFPTIFSVDGSHSTGQRSPGFAIIVETS